jgi:hypothetical protein
MNVLREMGLVDSAVSTDISRVASMSKDFNGIWNPHAEHRTVSSIPIELNIFKAMRHYLDYTLNDIYIAPIAALVHEMANSRVPIGDTKRTIKLVDHNPALYNTLRNWENEIMGRDPVGQALLDNHPGWHKALTTINKNIPAAMIGGSLRTIAIQPSSILGTMVNTTTHDTLYGIGRLFIERPFKGRQGKAWREGKILDIRSPDIAFTDAIEMIQMGVLKGIKANAVELGYVGMKWTDSLTAEVTWNAGERYARKTLKYSPEKARVFADDLVDTTQGLGIKGAVSPIQTSIATKWIALLGTFGITDFNLITRDILGIKNPDINNKVQVGKVLKYLIGGTLIGMAFKTIGIDNVFPDPVGAFQKAKEEGSNNPKALYNAALELLEKLPLIGGISKYGSSPLGIVGETASIVGEAIKDSGDILDWDSMTPRERWKYGILMGTALGYVTGMSFTNQMRKSFRAYYKGGNPYEVLMGIYVEEKKRKGAPNFKLETPKLDKPEL